MANRSFVPFLRIRHVNRQLLYDLLIRISPSARPNDAYARDWIEKALDQFRRWRHILTKRARNHLDHTIGSLQGVRTR
jgi:hypothetical protein